MMPADDPRHGTEAGNEQHRRDGEDPCPECDHAKLIAARRRTKRKTQGFLYTLPGGPAYDRIIRWREGGASYDDISILTGLEESNISRLLLGGRDTILYARTYNRIMRAPTKMPLTSVGATRRIQALHRLGYSAIRIAEESGVNLDTILDARYPRVFIARRVRVSIADAYERLHMSIPDGDTKQVRAGITRARNLAERSGWSPPLAWDDIDDAAETPAGAYVPSSRIEQLTDLHARGSNITEVCRALKASRDTLQKWCSNNGLSHVYRDLAGRESHGRNQYTSEVA